MDESFYNNDQNVKRIIFKMQKFAFSLKFAFVNFISHKLFSISCYIVKKLQIVIFHKVAFFNAKIQNISFLVG